MNIYILFFLILTGFEGKICIKGEKQDTFFPFVNSPVARNQPVLIAAGFRDETPGYVPKFA
jgi:hypothetical protein